MAAKACPAKPIAAMAAPTESRELRAGHAGLPSSSSRVRTGGAA